MRAAWLSGPPRLLRTVIAGTSDAFDIADLKDTKVLLDELND
jgi:hypothetical protein